MRKKRKDPVKIVLGASVGMLFCVAAFFAFKYVDTTEKLNAAPTEAEMTDLAMSKAALEDSLQEKETELTALEEKIASLENELQTAKTIKDAETADSVLQAQQITSQTAQIAELKKQAEAVRKEVATYKSQLEKLQKTAAVDWEYRSELLSDLYVMLAKGAPLLTPDEEEETEETKTAAETEEVDPKEEWEAMYPTLALYYEDLTTGYHVSYNEDKVMYSASLIKAPYIYAVVKEIEAFEEKKLHFADDGSPLYDENGNPLFTGKHPNLDADGKIIYKEGEEKYDLSRMWKYDPETMMEEGSGKIQYEKKDFELSWEELFEYTLLFSDNVAFRQIRNEFGMTSFQELAKELSFKGTPYGFMQLTASDCGKFLKVLYEFFAAESKYAVWMQDLMCRSAHTVMIPATVSPTKAAHKYGWDEDSYHDMAVVFDENPYILVVMTTLEDGGSEADAYIRSLVQQCRKIHIDVQKERDEMEATE
ncbi:MAG: serine hydrolase [Clostridia bacterium]|nr:serine hydrolase [Clostridia bacterium]